MSIFLTRTRGIPALISLLANPASRTRYLLICMLFAGLGASFSRYGIAPRAFILILIPVFVILISWLYLQATARSFVLIRRSLPAVCLENERVTVEIELCFNNPLPFAKAYLADNFPAVDILTSPEIMLQNSDFAHGGKAIYTYSHKLNRGYGDFMIGPMEIRLQDPFSFFEKKLTLPEKTPLKVWLNPPAPEDLDLVKSNALTPMGDSRSSQVGNGMDFYGIKEYAHGDDIRAMSWLKTAQTGRAIIKQFERDTRPDILIAIHTDRQQLRGQGYGNTMKRLFRIAAAILGETQRAGLPASFVVCIDNEAHCLRLNSSTPVFGFMTELLGSIEPAEEDSLQKLLDQTLSKTGPGSIVIFLSQTIHLPLDQVVHTLLTMRSRGAKVSFRAIDDSGQARFSGEAQIQINKDEVVERLNELDIDCKLLSLRKDDEGSLKGVANVY